MNTPLYANFRFIIVARTQPHKHTRTHLSDNSNSFTQQFKYMYIQWKLLLLNYYVDVNYHLLLGYIITCIITIIDAEYKCHY